MYITINNITYIFNKKSDIKLIIEVIKNKPTTSYEYELLLYTTKYLDNKIKKENTYNLLIENELFN